MQLKRYIEPYGVFGAMVGDVDQPRATFIVQLTGAGAILDKGGQRASYYDGEKCTISAAAGYNVTSLQIEGGSTITELPYTFIVTRNTNITVTAVPKSFADYTWSEIDAVCEAGLASTLFAVGDEKDIELSTGEVITMLILGFNHDDLSDGSGKAGMSIGMKNLLATKYGMNATPTNEGGWDESEMRTSTMATLLSQLPSDLQSVIKQVNKKATAGGTSQSITTSVDKLFLFAMSEIFSATSIENSATFTIADYADAYNAEGTQYEYYRNLIGDNNGGTTANANLIKKLSNGSGSAHVWWLRSPLVNNSYFFRRIGSKGDIGSFDANNPEGVSFCFCI